MNEEDKIVILTVLCTSLRFLVFRFLLLKKLHTIAGFNVGATHTYYNNMHLDL